MAFDPVSLRLIRLTGPLLSIVLLAIFSFQQGRVMSLSGVDPALKKPRAPGLREPPGHRGQVGGLSRSGASPAAVLATLAICAAGGLIFGSVLGGTWYYVRGRTAQASPSPYVAPPMPVPSRTETSSIESMRVQVDRQRTETQAILERQRTAMQDRMARQHESMRQEMETRHAEIRDRMERMRASAVEFPRIESPMTPGFPEPIVPAFPKVVPDEAFPTRPVSAGPRAQTTQVVRPPLIERPVSVSYSRSVPRTFRVREEFIDPVPQSSSDAAEPHLARLRSLMHDPSAFSTEASWFMRRRSTLTDELAVRIEETIATFIFESKTPEAVTVLPRLLYWYGEADLPQLARLFVRLTETDDGAAALERRQTIVGTLQRYRRLDAWWRQPPAADVVRAMRGSKTVSGHFVPTLETLPTPFCPQMEELLLEMAFDGTPESTCAQRQALRNVATRDRLIDAALARLESSDEGEREGAYMVLAATEPLPTYTNAALEALASAFANESIEPSPLAHAALTRWLDEPHAERFDEYCDCECPIRRTAARAATGRFEKDERSLASIAK
jgi:hypothetical protein